MIFTNQKNTFRWIIIMASFIIVSGIMWKTYQFFMLFKHEERVKMEIWASSQSDLIKTNNLDANMGDLPLKVITSNKTTPMILVNRDGSIDFNNIDAIKAKDSIYLNKLIRKYEKENDPIKVNFDGKIFSTIYYGNSPLLNKVKYYPFFLILIVVLFAAVIFFFYSSNKNATQNKLWSGMAKETAHQIGTPLSSLIGWTEILKSENVNPDYILEIEKDVDRLKIITERFSKIGSLPTLEMTNIIEETIASYDYLKSRTSNLIEFEFTKSTDYIPVKLNKQLFSWTIENLVKNAIDAMKGRGKLTVKIAQLEDNVKIKVTDTGKGIAKKDFKKIFEPGYTTKKRGWGLGLSLTRRIIEDFHNGKIKVLHSEKDKGTTIQITLKSS